MKKTKSKKYSLNDRLDYYDGIVRKDFNTGEKKLTKKGQFAIEYGSAVSRGKPLNYDTLSDTRKKGVNAGLSARQKVFSIKY